MSADFTSGVMGKVRKPDVVLDWATLIIDSSKSTSIHFNLRASIPTRIPVSTSTMISVRSLRSQHIKILCSSKNDSTRGAFLCLVSLNSLTPSRALWVSSLRSTAKLNAALYTAKFLLMPAGLTPSFIRNSLKRSNVKASTSVIRATPQRGARTRWNSR
jgi:hypothetical protein